MTNTYLKNISLLKSARADLISDQDSEWFEAHPKRICRVRQTLLGEFPGAHFVVVVRCPGLGRMRVPIDMFCVAANDSEAASHSRIGLDRDIDHFDILPEQKVKALLRQDLNCLPINIDEIEQLHREALTQGKNGAAK